MESSGNQSIKVTSTKRSIEEQASVMYDNIQKTGILSQRNLYNESGDKVIDTYENNSPEWNCTKAETVSQMVKTINEVGPSNISAHLRDPNKVNVIDIAPSSVINLKAFQNNLQTNPGVSKVIPYPKDPSIHIEIPQ